MSRWLPLVLLLTASSVSAASSTNVRVQTVAVSPQVIVEGVAPPRAGHHAPTRRFRDSRRRRLVATRRHVPRPLSPGEFGRARHGL